MGKKEVEERIKHLEKRTEVIVEEVLKMGLDKAEWIIPGKTKKFGKGMHIIIPKQYGLDRDVRIIILKKKTTKED